MDAGLLAGDVDLLGRCIDSVEVREQKAALAAGSYYDSVTLDIEFCLRFDIFCLAQYIDCDLKIRKLGCLYRREARVARRRAFRVLDYLFCDRVLSRPYCADAAAKKVPARLVSISSGSPSGTGMVSRLDTQASTAA